MRILNAQPRSILCCVALLISSAAGLKADELDDAGFGNGNFGAIDLNTQQNRPPPGRRTRDRIQ